MKKFVFVIDYNCREAVSGDYTGDSGLVGYDGRPCASLDMAEVYNTETEADEARERLQQDWDAELSVSEIEIDTEETEEEEE